MNKKTKYIVISLSILLVLFGFEECSRRIIGGFAGSYPYVKTWEIDLPEAQVIEIIDNIKETVPQSNPPAAYRNYGGRSSYWYFYNLYYPDTNEVIRIWLRPNGNKTTLALVFFCDPDANGNYSSVRYINRDFWLWSNIYQINKFENFYVDPIKRWAKQWHNR